MKAEHVAEIRMALTRAINDISLDVIDLFPGTLTELEAQRITAVDLLRAHNAASVVRNLLEDIDMRLPDVAEVVEDPDEIINRIMHDLDDLAEERFPAGQIMIQPDEIYGVLQRHIKGIE